MKYNSAFGWFWPESSESSWSKQFRICQSFLQTLYLAGEICELGCYKGEMSRGFVEFLAHTRIPKRVHLYDSFEGLHGRLLTTKDKTTDEGFLKRHVGLSHANPGSGRLVHASEQDVYETMRGLPTELYEIHKGYFHEQEIDFPVAFALIDADLYGSTRDAIALVKPHIVPGGCIVFDDYGADEWWPGVKKAVDEVFADDPDWWFIGDVSNGLWQGFAYRNAFRLEAS